MDTVINHNRIHVLPDENVVFEVAAEDFINRATEEIQKKDFFSVVLSGGNTPKLFFKTIVNKTQKKDFPWQKIQFYFGDERFVASEDENNNYHMAYEYLFSQIPVPAENIHAIATDSVKPEVAAKQYERLLKKAPLFDLVYLGVGANAHTASLIPNSELVRNCIDKKNTSLVAADWVADLKMYRITLTPLAINNSRRICFIVTGEDKALAVWQVLKGPYNPLQYPAQLIRCAHGDTVWYLNSASAHLTLSLP